MSTLDSTVTRSRKEAYSTWHFCTWNYFLSQNIAHESRVWDDFQNFSPGASVFPEKYNALRPWMCGCRGSIAEGGISDNLDTLYRQLASSFGFSFNRTLDLRMLCAKVLASKKIMTVATWPSGVQYTSHLPSFPAPNSPMGPYLSLCSPRCFFNIILFLFFVCLPCACPSK